MSFASVNQRMPSWATPLHASDPGLPLTPGLAVAVLGVSVVVLLVIVYVFYVDYQGVFA